jgi:hypothetical protein
MQPTRSIRRFLAAVFETQNSSWPAAMQSTRPLTYNLGVSSGKIRWFLFEGSITDVRAED